MDASFQPGQKALQLLLTPIVRWCVRIGIGHSQLSRIVKPLFYEAAQHEIKRSGIKCSDSALSLASGLHKGDITLLHQGAPSPTTQGEAAAFEVNRIHPSSQIVARWLALRWPKKIPTRGTTGSFDSLVKACQLEGAPFLSTKLLLQDLKRRGLVEVVGENVRLISEVGLPEIDSHEGVLHFVGSVRDHIEACLANLETGHDHSFLEQSIQADGLYPESVSIISKAARDWWIKAMQSITAQAISLSQEDEPNGGDQRLRFGVYFYTQPMTVQFDSKQVEE